MNPRFHYLGVIPFDCYYIEREADRRLLESLTRGEYCHVLGPRQVGKSSLRLRTATKLRSVGYHCASIELSEVGSAETPSQWYLNLAEIIAKRLSIAPPDAPAWLRNEAQRTPVRQFEGFLRDLLHAAPGRFVLFFDEIDAINLSRFSLDDFLLFLRSLFTERVTDPELQRITICLIGVANPNDLIRDPTLTQFNVSQEILLPDFSRSELGVLIPGLDVLKADSTRLLDAVHSWTDGHPYMTMKACSGLVELGAIPPGTESEAVEQVITERFLDRPLADTNLRYTDTRFRDPTYSHRGAPLAEKISLLQRLNRGETTRLNHQSAGHHELQLCGIVKSVIQDDVAVLKIRSLIFRRVFDQAWLRTVGKRRAMSEAVWAWLDNGQHPSWLLHGTSLEQAEEWANTNELTEDERIFLAASRQRETERAQQELANIHAARESARAEFSQEHMRLTSTVSLFDSTIQRLKTEADQREAVVSARTSEIQRLNQLENTARRRTKQAWISFIVILTLLICITGWLYQSLSTQRSTLESQLSDLGSQVQTLELERTAASDELLRKRQSLDQALLDLEETRKQLEAQRDTLHDLKWKQQTAQDLLTESERKLNHTQKIKYTCLLDVRELQRIVDKYRRSLDQCHHDLGVR